MFYYNFKNYNIFKEAKRKLIAILLVFPFSIIFLTFLFLFFLGHGSYYNKKINFKLSSKMGSELKEKIERLGENEEISVVVMTKDILSQEEIRQLEKRRIRIDRENKYLPIFSFKGNKKKIGEVLRFDFVKLADFDKPVSARVIWTDCIRRFPERPLPPGIKCYYTENISNSRIGEYYGKGEQMCAEYWGTIFVYDMTDRLIASEKKPFEKCQQCYPYGKAVPSDAVPSLGAHCFYRKEKSIDKREFFEEESKCDEYDVYTFIYRGNKLLGAQKENYVECNDLGVSIEDSTSASSMGEYTTAGVGEGINGIHGFTGSGVKVCVIDSGVNYNHKALIGKVIDQIDFVNNDNDAMDDGGHGTFVSGIIVSGDKKYKGLAPGASILSVKALDENIDGRYSFLISGIDWCLEKGADVINLSLGGNTYYKNNCNKEIISEAVNYVVKKYDVPIIASAGNSGSFGIFPPACASGAIAVGSVSKLGNVNWWSSRGEELDILAPGSGIKSLYYLDNDYAMASGTSFSVPYVSAVVSLLLEKKPDLGVEDIKKVLYNSTFEPNYCYECTLLENDFCYLRKGNCTKKDKGKGILDAYKAVEQVEQVGVLENLEESGEEKKEDSEEKEPEVINLPGIYIPSPLIVPPLPKKVKGLAMSRILRCGDGVLEKDEECDDGNNRNGDGCSSLCKEELADGGACVRRWDPYLAFLKKCHSNYSRHDCKPFYYFFNPSDAAFYPNKKCHEIGYGACCVYLNSGNNFCDNLPKSEYCDSYYLDLYYKPWFKSSFRYAKYFSNKSCEEITCKDYTHEERGEE